MEYKTKQDFVSALDTILDPITPTLDCSDGAPCFGGTAAVYPEGAVSAEAFLRPLWGLAPYWYGGGKKLKDTMRRGIVAGTDPDSPTYWGKCGRFDQRFVEMAPLAFAMLLTPDVVWEPLSDTARDNLCAWLWQINENAIPTNNWRFFRILTNLALRRLDRPFSEEKLNEDRADIESYYIGGGWYSDGPRGQRDFYVAWALHYYGLIYSRFEHDAYADTYRARAKEFAKDFIYWFSDRGAAIPYGRSLTYRMAQASFFSACLFAGVDVFDMGVLKGVLSRHLDDWLSAPLFDNAGVLSIGYKYPNLMMAEHYNAPGSPYWAMKYFAHLALPDDHPFWQAPVSPMPTLDAIRSIPEADMLVLRHRGDAFAYVGGTIAGAAFGQVGAKYLKFVYSTRFGINLKHCDYFDIEALTDSTLCFEVGGVFCDRRFNMGHTFTDDGVAIRWSPIRGITVTTYITATAASHTRRHVIESAFDCAAYDTGFAVACRGEDDCTHHTTDTSAEAKNNFSLSRVTTQSGGTPMVILTSPNTNLTYNKTVLPAIKYTIPRGKTEIVTVVDVE